MKDFKNVLQKNKIALVYDKVNTWGGAERVLLALHEIFPEAPLFTSVYDKKRASWAKIFPKVIPSFLQKFPFTKSYIQCFAPVMPLAFESHNFKNYDVVISITSGEAKGIVTQPNTLHLCYCLTPTRYLWIDPGYSSYNFNLFNNVFHLIKLPFLSYLRIWDQIASSRPDTVLAISKTVQRRIKKYYRRDSEIIFPPVDTKYFVLKKTKKEKKVFPYFLIVSRLTGYKKIDLAIKACQKMKVHLKIAGNGPDFKKLRSMAKTGVEVLGEVTGKELLTLYQDCRALIMPQEEDFGIVALEAQACGKPIIAYDKGGVKDTVIENKTGIFFKEQTVESLIDALKKIKIMDFDPKNCRLQAEQFSIEHFKENMTKLVLKRLKAHKYDKISYSNKFL